MILMGLEGEGEEAESFLTREEARPWPEAEALRNGRGVWNHHEEGQGGWGIGGKRKGTKGKRREKNGE